MDIIANKANEPTMQDIAGYFEDAAGKRWQDALAFIEETFKAKPLVAYSVCSAKPGWNVKYKKSGKALCTLYPEKDKFVALVVLNGQDMQLFDLVKQSYTSYLNSLYDNCKLFNGTKWLMISVTDDAVLEDVKKLMQLKLAASRK